ncbi:MAG: tRNA-binding protein, partial [Candidatus Marinimicrobia bacterium]|nr:tRNA-binding protein [Candidatus Neomarinimicrobiota bacterium]
MIGIKEFNKMDLRVGTIEQAEKFSGAKHPAYKLYIN